MTEQKWFCEKCGVSGSVPLDQEYNGVFEVVYKIGRAHVAASPECDNDAFHLRVVNHWVETDSTPER